MTLRWWGEAVAVNGSYDRVVHFLPPRHQVVEHFERIRRGVEQNAILACPPPDTLPGPLKRVSLGHSGRYRVTPNGRGPIHCQG